MPDQGGPGPVLPPGEPGTGEVTTGDAPFIALLVNFCGALRRAGLPAGSGDVLAYCTAMVPLDPTDLMDLYWAGRVTLVTRREAIAVYDAVFRWFFLDGPEPAVTAVPFRADSVAQAQAVLEVPAAEPPADGATEEQEARLGLQASGAEVLRHRAFPACTPDELAALRRIMARIRLTPPRRRTRRMQPARSGTSPDLRRTVREALRMHGEPAQLHWRRRRVRLRPLILVLDVSGSMADYSRALLQFAYSAQRAAAKVEVFCFGTRLTRISRALDHRKPDQALERAAAVVFDWEGGTRIGDSLDTFVREWGRRGLARGAIVVICSDGLDRGDPAVLAAAMARLSRLSYRLVWMNPHKGSNASFRPSTVGMMAAEPYIDLLLSGHDLSSLEQLATLLPTLN
ncbi:MAG: VWA domain-containing protein [Actinomycetota bacterium]